VEGTDERGIPVLIAYRTSPSTQWTSFVEVPMALVAAPMHRALWEVGILLTALLLAGGLAALITASHVARPIDELTRSVVSAERQVGELSEQLLALQEEERRRIARELHDSTAQHLVASHLGLMHLEGLVKENGRAKEACERLQDLIDQALKELRVFTYLLHPPCLAEEGLKATLEAFLEGFSSRTNILTTATIPAAADDLPYDLQCCLLRIVQEALANVSRHADASRVTARIRLGAERLILRIADDGRGMVEVAHAGSRPRLGVGIPGMRARLKQFGGDLRIFGVRGVTVLAMVPIGERKSSAGVLRGAKSGFARRRIRVLESFGMARKSLE
jgi:signal transduction histidine kinase